MSASAVGAGTPSRNGPQQASSTSPDPHGQAAVTPHPPTVSDAPAPPRRYPDPVVPGMLVHVAPDQLAALRGDADEKWTIRRGELLDPGLLGPADWTLYVATVRAARVHVVAYLEAVAADRDE